MRRRANAVAAAALGLLLLNAGSALAGTRTATTQLSGDGNAAFATAKCPPSQKATGGGFQVPPASGGMTTAVFESRKVGQRSWRIGAQLHDPAAPSGAVTIAAFAQCGRGAPATAVKEFAPNLVPGEIWNAKVGCPHGRVQAGGFSVTPAGFEGDQPRAGVTDSLRFAKKRWQVTVPVLLSAPTVNLRAYAYCGPGKVKARTASASISGSNAVTALTERCPAGTRVQSGGFAQTPNTKFVVPFTSVRSGRSWLTAGQNLSASHTLESFAYCGS